MPASISDWLSETEIDINNSETKWALAEFNQTMPASSDTTFSSFIDALIGKQTNTALLAYMKH